MSNSPTRGMTLAERFHYYCPEGDPDECWEWTGFRTGAGSNGGYGGISVAAGKWRGAHVVAWELAHGRKVPKGWEVRHRCDNPPCCNWHHLVLGKQLHNARDRELRNPGTQARGSRQGHAKLTEAQVAEIRELLTQGVKQRDIAARFGVTQSNISKIKNHQWRHVTYTDNDA